MRDCFATRLFKRVNLELFGVRDVNRLGVRRQCPVVTQCIRFSITAKPHKSTNSNHSSKSREMLNITLKIAALVKKYSDEKGYLNSNENISAYISENIAAVIRDKSSQTYANCWKNIDPKKIAVYSKRFSDRTEVYVEVARFTFSPESQSNGAKSRTCVVLLGVQCRDDLSNQSDVVCVDEREYALVLAKEGKFSDIKSIHQIFNHRIGRDGSFNGKREFSKQITLVHPGFRTNGEYCLGLAELCVKAICWNLPLSESLPVQSCLVDRKDDLIVEFDDVLTPVVRDILLSGRDGLDNLCENISAVEMSPVYCEIIYMLFASCLSRELENHREVALSVQNFVSTAVNNPAGAQNNLELLIREALKNEVKPDIDEDKPENCIAVVALCSFTSVVSKKFYGNDTQKIRSEINRLINNGVDPLNQIDDGENNDFFVVSPDLDVQESSSLLCATWDFLSSENSGTEDAQDDAPPFDPIENESTQDVFNLFHEIQSADPSPKRQRLS